MATQAETVEFILGKLRHPKKFSTRKMFGEYALYAEGKVVALVCDDTLYIKILPASKQLEDVCEKGEPYPSAKPYYIVEEDQLTKIPELTSILLAIAKSLPSKKAAKKPTKKKTSRK